VLGEELLGTCVLVYLDDLLIYSKTAADHLKEVLQKLREAKLYLKEKKCHFLQQKVEFWGHTVSEKGVGVDPRNNQKSSRSSQRGRRQQQRQRQRSVRLTDYVSTTITPNQRAGPTYEEAVAVEVGTILGMGTLDFEQQPSPTDLIIDTKPVFKTKVDAAGSFERFKARLVARGF